MKIAKIQLGTYANLQPFCVYQIPLALVPAFNSATRTPITPTDAVASFYKLRDLDILFFESAPGHLYTSNKIPRHYFEIPGQIYRDSKGDLYLIASGVCDVAAKANNHLLAEFAKLSPSDILAGAADTLLSQVKLQRLDYYAETEDEFPIPIQESAIESKKTGPLNDERHSELNSSRTSELGTAATTLTSRIPLSPSYRKSRRGRSPVALSRKRSLSGDYSEDDQSTGAHVAESESNKELDTNARQSAFPPLCIL